MDTTEAITEWDSEGGQLVKFNGLEVIHEFGRRPIYLDESGVLVYNFAQSGETLNPYKVTTGQRVLPERPEGVPETAIPATVWVEPPADGQCKTYYATGVTVAWSSELVEGRYGVTFPEPEPEPKPTPESILASLAASDGSVDPEIEALLAIEELDAAGYEIVRKADKTEAKSCTNCGRPLELYDDGEVYRDPEGDPRHASYINGDDWYCDASHATHATAPEAS